MTTLIARPWPTGYRLIDSGGGRKLEDIAGRRCDRHCPGAVWRPRLPASDWQRAVSRVERTKDGGGFWTHQGGEPQGLSLAWTTPNARRLVMPLRLTSFGHCGVFFEAEPLWRVLHAAVARKPAKALNLFGYTGMASLVMAAAGAEVFHVDSAKGVLSWGKEGAAASDLGSGTVRWVHEDALAFLAHSQRKGFTYDVICADPPNWGHGKQGETWQFDEQAQQLADACAAVLTPGGVIVLSAHTPGVQAAALVNLLLASGQHDVVAGELAQAHADDPRQLPAGVFAVAGDNGLVAAAVS